MIPKGEGWHYLALKKTISVINPIHNGPFWGCSRMVGPRRAPYLKSGTHILQWWNLAQLILPKEDPKSIWITWHSPWVLLRLAFFHCKFSKFGYIKKYRYRLHFDRSFLNILTFFKSLKIALTNMVTILIMSAKMGTLSLLEKN